MGRVGTAAVDIVISEQLGGLVAVTGGVIMLLQRNCGMGLSGRGLLSLGGGSTPVRGLTGEVLGARGPWGVGAGGRFEKSSDSGCS